MTIDAERKRTFGRFYKEKKYKGNLFKAGKKIQAFFKNDWYNGILQSVNKVGEWKIKLDYLHKILNLKQHCIRKVRGESAQHRLNLIRHDNCKEKKITKSKKIFSTELNFPLVRGGEIKILKNQNKKTCNKTIWKRENNITQDAITLNQLKIKFKEILNVSKKKKLTIKELMKQGKKKLGKKTLII